MSTTLYNLVEVLTEVAKRSFYEPITVIPVFDATGTYDGYLIEDSYNDINVDEVSWSYSGGITTETGLLETSQLFEPCETIDNYRQVMHYLPDSIEMLENGTAVTFAYAMATDEDAYNEHYENCTNHDSCNEDIELAGWVILTKEWA